MSKKFKKALRIAVNVGCGFEGDAEDAAELLALITGLESRIAELSQAVGLITTLKPTMVMDVDHPLDMAKEVEAYVTARIAELEGENDQLTAHSDIERHDDKSPNDTQTDTVVYGKESEE